jgi:hypothetical protein
MSKIAATGTSNLAELIEDHALESVPADQRKSGWALAWSTTGIVTTLIQLLIGSYVAAVVGFGNWAGVLTIVVASVVSYVLRDRHIFRLGSLLALVITLILYPLLRLTILRPGTLTSRKPALTAGSQAAS